MSSTKTITKLADGRELIYYDERPGMDRSAADTRDLPALDDEERHELARLHLDVLRRFDGIFGTKMPYIAAWHQAPVRGDRDLAHLYLQVFSVRRAPGKLKYLAGSESAAGVWVNDIAPERAARLLRDAL